MTTAPLARWARALRLLLGASALVFVGAWHSGCAASPPVKPWQREYLARPSMTPDSEEYEEVFRTHIRDAREGSIGAYGQPGGGCGCN